MPPPSESDKTKAQEVLTAVGRCYVHQGAVKGRETAVGIVATALADARADTWDAAIALVKEMEQGNKDSYGYWKSVASDPEHWGVMKFVAYSGEDSRVIAALEAAKDGGK